MCTHLHCLPVMKREEDRQALRRAVVSGDKHFFLGTDSAPHLEAKKSGYRAPGGIFTAHAALELYFQVFEEDGGYVNALQGFVSENGPKFYGLPVSNKYIELRRERWTVNDVIRVSDGGLIVPFFFEEDPARRRPLQWRLSTAT